MDIHRSHLRADGTTWPPVTPDPPPPPGYVDPIPELEAALDESVALEHDEAGSKPDGGPDEG